MAALMGCRGGADVPPDFAGEPCPRLIGVWPTWTDATEPTTEQLDSISHLAIAFALPTHDGELDTADVDKVLPRLKPLLSARDIEMVLSIGGAVGYGDAFIDISKDERLRAKFSENVTQYVIDNGFDGVDIDWEFWSQQAIRLEGGNDPVESRLLLTLLKDLRESLPAHVELSADIFAGRYYGPQYLSEMQNELDFVNLMAFDFTGAWPESDVSHHSDDSTVRLALKDVENRGFRAENLVVGIPAYGIRFEDGKTDSINKVPHKDIIEPNMANLSAVLDGDRIGHTFFETPSNTRAKVWYAMSKGVRGFFLFDLTQDTAIPEWSILASIDRAIEATSCSR